MLFLETTRSSRMPEKATEWPQTSIYSHPNVTRPVLSNNNALRTNVAIIAINTPQYGTFS
jgi:hypothetical protein